MSTTRSHCTKTEAGALLNAPNVRLGALEVGAHELLNEVDVGALVDHNLKWADLGVCGAPNNLQVPSDGATHKPVNLTFRRSTLCDVSMEAYHEGRLSDVHVVERHELHAVVVELAFVLEIHGFAVRGRISMCARAPHAAREGVARGGCEAQPSVNARLAPFVRFEDPRGVCMHRTLFAGFRNECVCGSQGTYGQPRASPRPLGAVGARGLRGEPHLAVQWYSSGAKVFVVVLVVLCTRVAGKLYCCHRALVLATPRHCRRGHFSVHGQKKVPRCSKILVLYHHRPEIESECTLCVWRTCGPRARVVHG